MQVRWTEDAYSDLEAAAQYLFEHAGDRAGELVRALYEAPLSLTRFPARGRPGRKHGTRELILTSLPYFIVYRISDDAVHVLRILHTAQRWP